jgi:hypothetical protein
VSRAGDELLFSYTMTSSPWLHDEQGMSRAGRVTVVGDGSDRRNTSGRVRAKFLIALVPNLERIFYFVESSRSTLFQSNKLKMERSRSIPPNTTLYRHSKPSPFFNS